MTETTLWQELTPTNPEMQRQSLMAWVMGRRLATPKGDALDFVTSPWLAEIYEDDSRVMAIVKSSQARISTYAIFRALHFSLYNRVTTIFTEPTRDDAQKFSTSRVTPILEQNAWLLMHVSGGTELRRVAQEPNGIPYSHIHFRGTWGEKEAFTIDADMLVIDELDESNGEVVATFDTRLIASRYKQKLQISTPSIPNYGIDAAYRLTDQRAWLWKCAGCNAEVNAQEQYYSIIDRERMRFRCPRCGRALNRARGQWVARYPERPLRGYSITQAMCLYVPVGDIVAAELVQKPRKFANFWLGVASDEGVASVTREMILQKCFLNGHGPSRSSTGGGRVMGVDQGDRLYYEVRDIRGEARSRIVELGTTRDWGDLYSAMRRHEVEVCVVDARPEIRLARKMAADFRGRVWFCEYANIPTPVRWKGKERWHILANRSQCLDAAAEDIAAGLVQLYAPMDDEIDQECIGGKPGGWIQHWCNQHRLEPEEPDGVVVWKETGPDHRSHANAYAKIAESRLRRMEVGAAWVPTGGKRMFGSAQKERPVASEAEIQEQPRVQVMGRPVVDLRKGMR
jgi:DNA-directed RNA polymerase subunit RPC12/RpoP